MTFFPDMKTVLTIGSLHVTWYAVFILTGAFLAYFLSLRQFKKWGYNETIFENFFLMMLPIGVIGARIYYVIFEWNEIYVQDPIRIFFTWEGGLAIHGGIIAASIFGFFYFRKHRCDLLRIADVIFPNLMIAQAIGRWGNFINQEAFGGVVSADFYKHWPAFIRDNMYINGEYHQPTFLYESVGNIIGFCLITFIYKKYGRKKRGDLAWAYLTWYGMVRFIVEGMRTDSLMIGSLRMAQIISLVGVFIGVLGIFGVWNPLFKKYWPFRKNKPVVIFDLDGTLVDTKDLVFASFVHTFKKYKPDYVLSEEELYSFLGPTLKQSFARYFDASLVDELIAYYREFNHKVHDEYVKEVPHVKETLQYLKENDYDIAIVSNKLQEIVRMGLRKFDLEQYFDVVIGSEDMEKAKPSPKGLLKACELLHRTHDDIVYIGDAPSDIRTCKNMGAYSVAFILEDNRANEMMKEKPCAFITDMKELITILKEEQEWSDVTI
ncbi:prolipoprotein diacylglyceryl transferase [Amedibacillus sp. YH-ame6]